jgi:hypothetical protein
MTARRIEPDGPDFNVDLHLAQQRMTTLHDEAHTVRRSAAHGPGVVTALRARLGRGLIAIGSAIAPDRALVSRPVRRP